MRSSKPLRGIPWPRDMTIRIGDGSQSLEDLLWVREAWGLEPGDDDLPPALSVTPAPAIGRADGRADTRAWAEGWSGLWRGALAHAAFDRNSIDVRTLSDIDDLEERAELLARIVGPTWRARFGDEAFNDGYDTWSKARFDTHIAGARVPLREDPERRSLDALIPAWRAGLTTIVTIPCRGEYTRTVTRHAILMTEETRSDPSRYAAALHHFA